MSTTQQLHLYEGIFIANAALSEDARTKFLEKLYKQITDRSGEIKNTIMMGRKKLAYQIKGHREGYYYLVYFTIDPTTIKDLWSEYNLNEDLVRFMMMRTEEAKESLEFKVLGEL